MSEITTQGSTRLSGLPREVLSLAGRIAAIHGDIVISRETKGIHLNFASPIGLERDGEIELAKKHLALNAEKYCQIGMYKKSRGTFNSDRSAYCMKYSKGYLVTNLLKMKPLKARGYNPLGDGSILAKPPAYLIEDANGNKIPDHPGEMIPLMHLGEDHPCIQFIRSRNYEPEVLAEQFRCGFCYAEAPESKDIGRFYRRMPGNWKDTPQGRLIFYCDIMGIQVGWQARVIERIHRGVKQHLHPYTNEWETTHTYGAGKWNLVDRLAPQKIAFSKKERKWDPSKYRTAWGAKRNELIMGLDAAIRWNKDRGVPVGQYMGLFSEGPLDAARFGPPAMAYLGKYFSLEQSVIISKYFKHLGFLRDNDAAGEKTLEYLRRNLKGRGNFVDFQVPVGPGQDPGDLTPDRAELMKKFCIRQFGI